MSPIELARWQWQDYADFHQDRLSLRLHLLSVPIFWLGLAAIVGWPWHRSGLALVLGVVAIPLVFALQGAGHKREARAPKPFTSPLNAVARLFTEQLVTLPRYVLSGGLFRAMRSAA